MPITQEEQKLWLETVREEIIEPERRIVDPHHHMWIESGLPQYRLEDLWSDTDSGHNIEKTVFMECGAEYRKGVPRHEEPVGETEFVTLAAQKSRGSGKSEIAGIVAHTDLTQEVGIIRSVCAMHEEVADGLFRGIRHGGAHDAEKIARWGDATSDPKLYERPSFRDGVRELGNLGLTYDTWHYHFQNSAYADLARSIPNTLMVLDHFGTPLGVGPYADQRIEIFENWKQDIRDIAACENVVAKIGGLAMPPNGFGWHHGEKPPSSDEVVHAQREYYLYAIDAFGPDRCMFESNFPVDKLSLSYHVYWNAMKKLAAEFSESEKDAMFYGTASRVYRL